MGARDFGIETAAAGLHMLPEFAGVVLLRGNIIAHTGSDASRMTAEKERGDARERFREEAEGKTAAKAVLPCMLRPVMLNACPAYF